MSTAINFEKMKYVRVKGVKPIRVLTVETVTVMAIVGRYAMVRHPGCIPIVVASKQLEPITP